jgi:hypothetical protein
MKHLLHLFTSILLAFICACSQSSHKESVTANDAYNNIAFEKAETIAAPSNDLTIAENNAVFQRKIIKEGTIRFETTDIKKTREIILNSVNENKGYLANDNISNYYGGNSDYHITIRVPAENFDILLNQISNTAYRIDSKDIKALDVTEEFIDVEARIKTKLEIEQRYKELLKQAHKIDEILNIEKEIGLLRTEIEAFEGRLRYLKDKVAYSTLTITFYEQRETHSSSFGFGNKFINALYDGWINILWVIIGIVNLWPFILIITLIIITIRRIRKKHKKKTTSN